MRTRHTWAGDNSEKKGKTLVPSGFAVLGILVFILVFILVIMLVFILVIILIIPEIIV